MTRRAPRKVGGGGGVTPADARGNTRRTKGSLAGLMQRIMPTKAIGMGEMPAAIVDEADRDS